MPIDSQDGYPDDWARPALPPLDDGYPDDWYVPPSAEGAGFPDDWVGPVYDAPDAPQAAPGPQPGAMASARPNPSASDSFAAYLPFMPATQAAMNGWGWPNSGDAFGQSALPQVWPPALPPLQGGGLFGSLASPQPATNMPPFTASSLFGGDTQTRSDAGDSPSPPQVPNDPSSAQVLGASDGLGRLPLDSQLGSPLGPPIFDRARLDTSSDEERASSLPTARGLDRSVLPPASTDVGSSSEQNPSAAPESDEPGSIARVVRDSSGRPLAIVLVEPNQSSAQSFDSQSDASPDSVVPGQQYAQIKINTAQTGNAFIDRTTQFLLDTLEQTARALGPGRGPLFGIRVHTDFGRRVEELDLPGIGKDGVEQSFHFDFPNYVKYGLEGSIRTDVALRDPKNPDRGPIMVYDLKTGNAVLTPRRAAEIRNALNQQDLPIIVLRYTTLNAAFP